MIESSLVLTPQERLKVIESNIEISLFKRSINHIGMVVREIGDDSAIVEMYRRELSPIDPFTISLEGKSFQVKINQHILEDYR